MKAAATSGDEAEIDAKLQPSCGIYEAVFVRRICVGVEDGAEGGLEICCQFYNFGLDEHTSDVIVEADGVGWRQA